MIYPINVFIVSLVIMDMGLVKLVHRGNVSDDYNWIEAELTEEEKNLLRPVEHSSNFFSTGNLGYIDPSRVKKYFVAELEEEFSGSPNLRVKIDFVDEWEKQRGALAGDYYFTHPKKEEGGHIILFGPINKNDVLEEKIDPKYVIQDNSGKIIPITKERVEEELGHARSSIDNGYRGFTHLGDAERLAKIANLDYSKQIDELKKYDHKKLIERESSVKSLEKTLENLENWWGFGFDPENPSAELYFEFRKIIDEIEFPNSKLRDRTVNFLHALYEQYDHYIDKSEEEIKEQKEVIESYERNKEKIDLWIEHIKIE